MIIYYKEYDGELPERLLEKGFRGKAYVQVKKFCRGDNLDLYVIYRRTSAWDVEDYNSIVPKMLVENDKNKAINIAENSLKNLEDWVR